MLELASPLAKDTENTGMSDAELKALSAQVRREVEMTAHPRLAWMPEHKTAAGQPVLDVLIVGAGQGGLATAFELRRQRVDNVLVIDRAERGREGVWRTYARMPELRSPKDYSGPDLGVPSLTYEAWHLARHGAEDWAAVPLIRAADWADYLDWYRETLDLPVRNGAGLVGIDAGDGHLIARLDTADGPETLACRKIVLATGQDGLGRWWMPPEIEALPAEYRAHAADEIDFERLRGQRVAVIGAGASAADNASMALEAGAAEVRMFCRRPELQRVQPLRWLTFSGFLRHLGELDDEWRWRFMSRIIGLREGIPRQSFQRMARHKGFRFTQGAPIQAARIAGGQAILTTPKGEFAADFVITGTGMDVDPTRRPEFSGIGHAIALWSDRYTPPADEQDDRLARYPYLGPDQQFLEREPGTAPHLADIHDFTIATVMSLGPSGASINAMTTAVPRLVRGLTRGLFRADIEAHYRSFRAYDLAMFEFDEIEWAGGGPDAHIE
jgi:cation diffusion facilitator CzcD-associated flavoprotein CzcO